MDNEGWRANTMAKSKRRIQAAARKRSRKEAWKLMTPEARKEWSEKRAKTAKTGYAARTRERANGAPMADRTREGIRKRFVTPHSHQPSLGAWVREFHRLTA
jgi:hypothetical protein